MEHRRHRRLPAHAPAILRTSDGTEYAPCWITEVSREGIAIACEAERLPRMGLIEVILPLEGGSEDDWPRCHAQIVHRHGRRLGVWLGDSTLTAGNPLADHLFEGSEGTP